MSMPELVIGHPRTRLGLFGNRLYPTSCVQQGSVICMYLGELKYDKQLQEDDNVAYENGDASYYGAIVYGTQTKHKEGLEREKKTGDIIACDSRNKGNKARFINHSHDPNSQFHKWYWRGMRGIAIVATRDLYSYEEITICYEKNVHLFHCKCVRCLQENIPVPPPIRLRGCETSIPSIFYNYRNKLSGFITVLSTFSLRSVYNVLPWRKHNELMDPRPIFEELRSIHNTEIRNNTLYSKAISEAISYLTHFLWCNQQAIVFHRKACFTKYHLMVLTATAIKVFLNINVIKPSHIIQILQTCFQESPLQICSVMFTGGFPSDADIISESILAIRNSHDNVVPNVICVECPDPYASDNNTFIYDISENIEFEIFNEDGIMTTAYYKLVAITYICEKDVEEETGNSIFSTILAGPPNGDHYKYHVNNRNWYNLSHNNEWDPDSDIVVAQNQVLRDIYTSHLNVPSTFVCTVIDNFDMANLIPVYLYYARCEKFKLVLI
jgi:hypothetical protein